MNYLFRPSFFLQALIKKEITFALYLNVFTLRRSRRTLILGIKMSWGNSPVREPDISELDVLPVASSR